MRVLEDRVVEPLGGTRSVRVDIRVICATNQDLPGLIKQGRFREDLYYRLHVCPLTIPPLRERPEDIPMLLDAFLGTLMHERGVRIHHVSPDALRLLTAHPWPGNVRELHNAVEWISLSCKEDTIRPDHLPPQLRAAAGSAQKERPSLLSLGLSVEEVEKAMLEEALDKAGGNVSEAGRILKITRNTLRYRMEKYGLK